MLIDPVRQRERLDHVDPATSAFPLARTFLAQSARGPSRSGPRIASVGGIMDRPYASRRFRIDAVV
jgi:hypothetical protein